MRDWDVAASWDGRGTFDAVLPLSGPEPVVVLIQEKRYGPVVAAARLR